MSNSWDTGAFYVRKLADELNDTFESEFLGPNKVRKGNIQPRDYSINKDIYTGEMTFYDFNSETPDWAEGVDEGHVSMMAAPYGYRIEIDVDLEAPDVDGEASHTVGIVNYTDEEAYHGDAPPRGRCFVSSELVKGEKEKRDASVVDMFEDGEADRSINNPMFMGSSEGVSEAQGLIFLAEWAGYQMSGSSTFRYDPLTNITHEESMRPSDLDSEWAYNHFLEQDERHVSSLASRMSLEGQNVYALDIEDLKPSGINLFQSPLEEVRRELQSFKEKHSDDEELQEDEIDMSPEECLEEARSMMDDLRDERYPEGDDLFE